MYYLLLLIFYPLSLLPFWVLYRISDLGFVVIYHLIGYRKEIIRSNLSHAFPEKSEAEILRIQRLFYKGFCDQWVETIKLLSIRPKALAARMRGNWDLCNQLTENGKSLYLLSAHNFNWEWLNAAAAYHAPVYFTGVYLPVDSKGFDRLMYFARSRTGTNLISMKGLLSGMKAMRGKQYVIGLLADQNPSQPDVAAWLPFMHREAPFFRGPEQMARRAKAAVAFVGMEKIKRGHYRIKLETLTEDASQMPEGAVVAAYVAFVERQLAAQPENYLWSHRRWKHTRKDAVS
ncbi:MAG: lysophospholipid acyltransferase family protein [Chitinophagaceae bacterium]